MVSTDLELAVELVLADDEPSLLVMVAPEPAGRQLSKLASGCNYLS
jgi:hypothetical protein